MDQQRLSHVLDILGFMAVAHVVNLVDLVEEHGNPADILALEEARKDLAICARELAADFPELSRQMLEQTSEDIVRDSMSEIVARYGSPTKSKPSA